MANVLIPLAAAPAVISGSLRTVLVQKGCVVVKIGFTCPDNKAVAVQLTEAEIESLLGECGNNAAQALLSVELTSEPGGGGGDGHGGDGHGSGDS